MTTMSWSIGRPRSDGPVATMSAFRHLERFGNAVPTKRLGKVPAERFAVASTCSTSFGWLGRSASGLVESSDRGSFLELLFGLLDI